QLGEPVPALRAGGEDREALRGDLRDLRGLEAPRARPLRRAAEVTLRGGPGDAVRPGLDGAVAAKPRKPSPQVEAEVREDVVRGRVVAGEGTKVAMDGRSVGAQRERRGLPVLSG